MADDNQEGMYVSQTRSVSVSTTSGYTLFFPKGEPVRVPPSIREEMLSHGILPVDGDLPVKAEAVPEPEPVGNVREERIFQAVKLIAQLNDIGDFTGAGVPKTDALSKKVGFSVDARERNVAWERYLQETTS